MARIPVERDDTYTIIYNANSHLRYNVRSYFGPVDIERMSISLYSDKGQLLNLNGQDFSIALLIEQVYQY